MSKDFKKNVAFVFFLLAGITVGAFISSVCEGSRFLGWLAWGREIEFPTAGSGEIDLYVLRVSLGVSLRITIAQIITIPLSILVYAKTCKNI